MAPLHKQELDFLMQKHHVSLDGRIPPENWPPRYRTLFRLVWDADGVRSIDYKPSGPETTTNSQTAIGEMCARVEDLVQMGDDLREAGATGATWRISTQKLVLGRFSQEMECPICGKYYWISDLMATVRDTDAAECLCKCEKGKRDIPSRWAGGPFTIHQDCRLRDEMMPEIQRKVLSQQTTDLVVGFRQTGEFESLLSAHPHVQATGIESNAKVTFPFLVLQGKGEEDSAGFESIERQTVFANFSLLAIQRGLRFARDSGIDPLVWFLANRGEDWKVYACVPDNLGTRIIELWQGSIRTHDHALQLLLIIDLICHWAGTIFKNDLIHGKRDSGNAGVFEADKPNDTEQKAVNANMMNGTEGAFAKMKDITETLTGGKTKSWTDYVVIRSETEIQYRFRSISLPESMNGLTQILLAIPRTHTLPEAAQWLIALFKLKDPLIIKADLVYSLHRGWTKLPSWTTPGDPELNFACISFRTYFDYPSGLLTQELSCITASVACINILLYLASGTAIRRSLREDTLAPSRILPHTFQPFRCMSAPDVTQAAVQSFCLHLRPSNQTASADSWVLATHRDRSVETFWGAVDALPQLFWRCPRQIFSTVQRAEFPDVADNGAIRRHLGQSTGERQPVTITWLTDGRLGGRYCCILPKSDSQEDRPAIGRMVHEFLPRKNTGEQESDAKSALRHWGDILVGNKPPDAPWQ